MAEIVHLRLERGLAELEEMKRIGLFTLGEVRKIARRRSDFEYKLRKRNKSKEDFLQYIEYEICLLRLISKKRERLLLETKKKEIDNSIAKKINRLFKAVISRYPEDEKLWLNQIEYFKKMKWHDSLNALYTKLLQVHGNKPDLWIQAAKWEMESNNSPVNARTIFQRALLMHPKSEAMWHEYYRMELQYIEMIKKRREVLQLQKIKDDSKENDAVLNGDIVNVVYDNAVKEIKDVNFALSFINICMEFNAMGNCDYIFSYSQAKFTDCEETWDAIAKKPLLHSQESEQEGKQEGLSISAIYSGIYDDIYSKYEEAVKTLPTEKMYKFFLDFLFESFYCAGNKKSKTKMQSIILEKLEEAANVHCLSEEHYLAWLDLLEKVNDKEKLLNIARFGAAKFNSVAFWLKCLQLHILHADADSTVYLFYDALSAIKGRFCITPIWKLAVNWLSISNPKHLKEFFENSVFSDDDAMDEFKELYLETTASRENVQAARNLYQRFKSKGKLTPGLVKKMIKIEQSQLKIPLDLVRKYFEDGIKLFGSDNVEIWIDYINFEAKYSANHTAVNLIQWRGKKTLQPGLVEAFQCHIGQLLRKDKNCNSSVFAEKPLC